MAYKRLGDMLLDSGYITADQLNTALALQKDSGKRLGEQLIDAGYITEKELIDVLCMQLGIDFIDLTNVILPTDLTQTIPKSMAKKYNMVPVRATPDEVFVAMSDPMNFIAQEEARAATRRRIVPMVSTKLAIERAIMQLYGNEGAARAIEDMRTEAAASTAPGDATDVRFAGTTLDAEDEAQSAPTIRLVNSIIERAATERASDVHLEPREGDLQVRMRIDGLMRNVLTVPRDLQSSVISRLKIMGGMNIAERRVPQDGRANVRIKSRDIDLRLSTLPTIYGESVVVRLLDKSSQLLDPKGIGLYGDNLDSYHKLVHSNNGVLLIAGPTGSGKSSTMYTMIRELNTEQVKLITLEDPVEYNIDGINQVQINEKTGLTFSSGLRSILRQDPDIVAVGEIRDGETAEIAMRAAITGHLVLSTIHTYDALSTIDRLLDIGVEPYLIASGLRGIISQRLVRRICPHCREEYQPAPEDLEALGLPANSGIKFFHGKGCPMCFHTGYRGRTGVFEILVIDRELRRAIAENAGRDAIRAILAKSRFVTLSTSCIQLVHDGVTTVEEATRTINTLD
ncbi:MULTISPECIES: GspE/PulE family protein [Gordonibacter]|uniref:ATPase, T2SS/T4P/T4SS family n=1 Tax=Gordonibacter faecis TaxID=3047475 RepID=A0ABT7DK76_9ACTN|nr:type II/IV secretion system protein [Gordonibacter sp. KGMB12511]MDJ1649926.1 ATPase, T2SS/T4P/T4SS family [Gordonibacter sp. KGMB12511]